MKVEATKTPTEIQTGETGVKLLA